MTAPTAHARARAVMREDERVTALELFFDLVFVLALTQCTTLMSREASWLGLVKGLALLALLWWCWGGYAWLTSVVNPEEGVVRLVMFLAMAGLLVAALCIPGAFGSEAVLFVAAYATVRVAHLALFTLASRDDALLRRSVTGLAASSALGIALLGAAAFSGGAVRASLWALALLLDIGGPFLFGAEGWKLVPGHFADRHGAIIIIALGESIVAIGVGAHGLVDSGVVVAAILGMAIAAALWWTYFDVVALVATRRLVQLPAGRERNELARDSYSYMHYLMIAGIALIAVGVKQTLEDVGGTLGPVIATALLGGAALYLLGHVGFRLRNVHTLNRQRLVAAVLLLAVIPAASRAPGLAGVAGLAAVLSVLVAYEATRFAEARDRVRHQPATDE